MSTKLVGGPDAPALACRQSSCRTDAGPRVRTLQAAPAEGRPGLPKRSEARRSQSQRGRRHREHAADHPADGRPDLQLRRVRATRNSRPRSTSPAFWKKWLQDRTRHRRHADRVDGDLGTGQAGDRAWDPTSTISRRRRRSRASPITIRLSPARRVTAKVTTPACRCKSPPRSR